MSLPPERISIKRRRQEEPVQTLYLEPDHHASKRRFIEVCFQRVTDHEIIPLSSPLKSGKDLAKLDKYRAESNYRAAEPALLSATSPSAETRDHEQREIIPAKRLTEPHRQTLSTVFSQTSSAETAQPTNLESPNIELPKLARRFHLSRHSTRVFSPQQPSGVRKQKLYQKPYLATFVEKQAGLPGQQRYESSAKASSAVESRKTLEVLECKSGKQENVNATPPLKRLPELFETSSLKHNQSRLIQSPGSPCNARVTKQTRSIRDRPSTWDHDSDELAFELAAFALEMDPEIQLTDVNKHLAHITGSDDASTPVAKVDMDMDEGFVYETYVRVPMESIAPESKGDEMILDSIGVLVIEEENEGLWQMFAESDDETEWDEEDADSNAEDNPANDYPEDEVSSEDEYGYGAHTYRNVASDDEEFDLQNDHWSDENSDSV